MPQSNEFAELEAKLNALLSSLQEIKIPDVTSSNYIDAAAGSVSSDALIKLKKRYLNVYAPILSGMQRIVDNLRNRGGFSSEINNILDGVKSLLYSLAVTNTAELFSPSESEAKRAAVELRFYVKKILFEDLPKIKRLLATTESDKKTFLNYLTTAFPKSITPESAVEVIEGLNKFIQARPSVLEDLQVRLILNKFIEQLLRAILVSVQGKEILFNINSMRNEWSGFFRAIETGNLETKKSSFNAFTIVLKQELSFIEKRKVGVAPIEDAKRKFFEGISRYPVPSLATGDDAVKMLVFFRDSLKANPVLLNDKGVKQVFFEYVEKLIDRIFESRFVESISEQRGRPNKENFKENFNNMEEELKSRDYSLSDVVSFIVRDIDALIRLLGSAKGRVTKAAEVQKREANFIKNLDEAGFSRPETVDAVVLQIEGFFGVFQSNLFFMKSYDVRKKLLDFLENRCRYLFNEFFYRKKVVFDLDAIKAEAMGVRSIIISNDVDQQKRIFSDFIKFINGKIDKAQVDLGVAKKKEERKKYVPTWLGYTGTLMQKASRTAKVISMLKEDDVAGMKDSIRFLRAKLLEVRKAIDRIRSEVDLNPSDSRLVSTFFSQVERFVVDLKQFESNLQKYSIKSLKQFIPKRFNAVLVGFKPVQELFQEKVLA